MWTFDQPPNAAAIVCRSVMSEGRPILFVAHHDEDHGWQFLDGEVPPSDPVVVGMREVVDLDPSLSKLADLSPGGCAWRESPRHPWIRGLRKIG